MVLVICDFTDHLPLVSAAGLSQATLSGPEIRNQSGNLNGDYIWNVTPATISFLSRSK
jgi:hypothetical protein